MMITRKQLRTLISPDWDSYAYEHLSLLHEALKKGVLTLERRTLPKLPPPTDEERRKTRVFAQAFHSQESFDYAARVLYLTFKDRIDSDPNLKILDTPWYAGGYGSGLIGDVGLVRLMDEPNDYVPIIIVEIGGMKAIKPLQGLESSVEEFWIPIREENPEWWDEEDRMKPGIYVFKRGPNWHLWIQHQRREKREVEKAIQEVDPYFQESPEEKKHETK